jgi:hypothetical protein
MKISLASGIISAARAGKSGWNQYSMLASPQTHGANGLTKGKFILRRSSLPGYRIMLAGSLNGPLRTRG